MNESLDAQVPVVGEECHASLFAVGVYCLEVATAIQNVVVVFLRYKNIPGWYSFSEQLHPRPVTQPAIYVSLPFFSLSLKRQDKTNKNYRLLLYAFADLLAPEFPCLLWLLEFVLHIPDRSAGLFREIHFVAASASARALQSVQLLNDDPGHYKGNMRVVVPS